MYLMMMTHDDKHDDDDDKHDNNLVYMASSVSYCSLKRLYRACQVKGVDDALGFYITFNII